MDRRRVELRQAVMSAPPSILEGLFLGFILR